MRFAVDTGGTFTDMVIEDERGALQMFKAPTTPHDPVEGILDAVRAAAESMSITPEDLLADGDLFIHGTTHAINAVITGTAALASEKMRALEDAGCHVIPTPADIGSTVKAMLG